MDMKTNIVENMTTNNSSEEHSQEIDMAMTGDESVDHSSETGSYSN